jgi:hypothetical protein
MSPFLYFFGLVLVHQLQLYRDTGTAGVQFVSALRREMPAFTLALSRGPGRSSAELIRELTKLTAKDDLFRQSRFFTVVKALGYRQGINSFEIYGNAGRALPITAGNRRYFLVVLEAKAISVPGTEMQQVLLLDSGGTILDRTTCFINSRYGTLKTEVLDRPAKEGVHIAVQFIPEDEAAWLAWQTVIYRGKCYTFRYEEPDPAAVRPPPPWQDGLCRLKIQDGQFVCVFPKLVKPDPEKRRRQRTSPKAR